MGRGRGGTENGAGGVSRGRRWLTLGAWGPGTWEGRWAVKRRQAKGNKQRATGPRAGLRTPTGAQERGHRGHIPKGGCRCLPGSARKGIPASRMQWESSRVLCISPSSPRLPGPTLATQDCIFLGPSSSLMQRHNPRSRRCPRSPNP